MFLGEAGFAYATQAGPYVLFPQAACTGYVIGAIFFGRYLRRSRSTTVAEFFGRRFNSSRVQAIAGITIILALGGYLLGECKNWRHEHSYAHVLSISTI